MADPRHVRATTIALRPIDRLLLGFRYVEDVIGVILDDVVLDRRSFGPTLWTRFDVDGRHQRSSTNSQAVPIASLADAQGQSAVGRQDACEPKCGYPFGAINNGLLALWILIGLPAGHELRSFSPKKEGRAARQFKTSGADRASSQ
jgi:hypothetical protein